jgi:FtsZ-interacting cell division protein YlmF
MISVLIPYEKFCRWIEDTACTGREREERENKLREREREREREKERKREREKERKREREKESESACGGSIRVLRIQISLHYPTFENLSQIRRLLYDDMINSNLQELSSYI